MLNSVVMCYFDFETEWQFSKEELEKWVQKVWVSLQYTFYTS